MRYHHKQVVEKRPGFLQNCQARCVNKHIQTASYYNFNESCRSQTGKLKCVWSNGHSGVFFIRPSGSSVSENEGGRDVSGDAFFVPKRVTKM